MGLHWLTKVAIALALCLTIGVWWVWNSLSARYDELEQLARSAADNAITEHTSDPARTHRQQFQSAGVVPDADSFEVNRVDIWNGEAVVAATVQQGGGDISLELLFREDLDGWRLISVMPAP